MRKPSIAAVVVLISSHAIANDDLMMAAIQIFKPIPPAVPAIKDNPVTAQKVELGKMLLYASGRSSLLSKSGARAAFSATASSLLCFLAHGSSSIGSR